MLIITLYSTQSCGKCMLAESKLKDKIEHLVIKDTQLVLDKAQSLGITEMPILKVNDQVFSGREAVIKATQLVEGLSA